MKKIIKTITLLSLLMMLTGCMKMQVNMTIVDEDTVKGDMTLLFQEELLEAQGTTIEDLKELMAESGDINSSSFNEVEETIDGDAYVGLEMEIPESMDMSSYTKNLKVSTKDGKETYALTLTSDEVNDQLSESGMGSSDAMGGYSASQMKKAGVEMIINITMPYNITKSSVGEIDGKTVVIDLLDLMGGDIADITITAEEGSGTSSSNNNMYLYAAGGVAVVAIIAVAMIVRKNKKQVATDIPVNSDYQTPIVENDNPMPDTDAPVTTEESIEDLDSSTNQENTTDDVSPSDDIEETDNT